MPYYRKKRSVGKKDHLENVALLRRGAKTWNTWRADRPEVRYVGLAGAQLRNAELAGVNFERATLCESDLFRANLSGANLFMSDLDGAMLNCAILEDANLELATFKRASLFQANLSRTNLSGTNFYRASLRGARFDGAKFEQTSFLCADLERADFTGADLSGVDMYMADLTCAKLTGTKLVNANLIGTNLHKTNLRGADLRGALLDTAHLIETDFTGANLADCRVYGISAWNVRVDGAVQEGMVITQREEPVITVDNIGMAQFIYLLLNNANIRHIIDTITSKVVLILGRFTESRKAVLAAIREELKHRDYTPVIFDFQKPATRDLTEAITTLASMARFVIADITDAKSIPQELMAIVPQFPSVPIVPIILESQSEYGMFEHFKRYPWVLQVRAYQAQGDMGSMVRDIVAAAETYR